MPMAFRDSLSSSPEWHPDCHLERDALPPRLQSGTQTVTWNETHSLLVSRVASRLSPGTRRIPSSSPEWHPDCHLERDAFPPRLQSGTQTVSWNETHSLLVSRVAPRLSPGTIQISPRPALPTLGTWPALGIPLAPSSATSLAPGAETHKTPCPALPSSMAPGRSQSCPLQVGFGQTSRIGLSHMDCYYANDCFNRSFGQSRCESKSREVGLPY